MTINRTANNDPSRLKKIKKKLNSIRDQKPYQKYQCMGEATFKSITIGWVCVLWTKFRKFILKLNGSEKKVEICTRSRVYCIQMLHKIYHRTMGIFSSFLLFSLFLFCSVGVWVWDKIDVRKIQINFRKYVCVCERLRCELRAMNAI